MWRRDDEEERCAEESQKNERVPAPSGDFSFFFLTGAVKVGYSCPTNPFSISHNPRDVGHFQPPGPLPQNLGPKGDEEDPRWCELTGWCGSKNGKEHL